MNHRSHLRAVALRATAPCLGVLAACVLVEGAARWWGIRSGNFDPLLFSPNGATVYANRPGFQGDYAGAFVRINSLGFRGPELPANQKACVLLLGDSVAFGQGVEEQDTLAAVAGRRLEAVLGRRCEVLNAGVPGFNTANEAVRLEQIGATVGPSLVVVLYTDNDTDPQLFTGFRDGYPITADGRYQTETDFLHRSSAFLYRHSAAYNLLRLSTARLRPTSSAGFSVTTYQEAMARSFCEENPGFVQSMSALAQIRDWCRVNGAALLVAVWSRLPRGESDTYATAVLRHAEAMGIKGILLAPVGPGENPAQLAVPFDGHPNAAAHARMAAQLVDAVVAARVFQTRGLPGS
jgi:hypothetical protein